MSRKVVEKTRKEWRRKEKKERKKRTETKEDAYRVHLPRSIYERNDRTYDFHHESIPSVTLSVLLGLEVIVDVRGVFSLGYPACTFFLEL